MQKPIDYIPTSYSIQNKPKKILTYHLFIVKDAESAAHNYYKFNISVL
jgi:hypothetical protein